MSDMRPLLLGGVGGSGTRVIAQIVAKLGFYVGSNLNDAFDNLDWPGNRKLLLDGAKSDEEKLVGLATGFKPFAPQMLHRAEASGKASPFWARRSGDTDGIANPACSIPLISRR